MKGYVLNGRFVEGHDLVIQPHQPFFAHGQGLFETLRARRGRPMFLGMHLERMAHTAQLLELAEVPPIAAVRRDIENLVKRLATEDARVKLHLLSKDDGGADFLITAEPVEPWRILFDPVDVGRAAPIFSKGIAMAGLKTMNYMANRLAERDGRRRGKDEVIFTTVDDVVLEGTRTTVFMVEKGTLVTTPLSLPILPGVVRAVVIDVARRGGIKVDERPFTTTDLASSDEAMLTGSVGGIRPIKSFEDASYSPIPGPVTERVGRLFWDLLEQGDDLL